MAADPRGRDAGDGCPWLPLVMIVLVIVLVRLALGGRR